MVEEKFNSVAAILNGLSTSDIVVIWNAYCEYCRMDDDIVESMDSFDELNYGSQPLDMARRVFYGNFNPNDDYWYYNAYGNLASFSFWDDKDSPIVIDDGFVEFFCEAYEDRNDYISEDNIAEDFVEYINKNLGTDYSIQEIYDLSDKGEEYDLDTILNDDWDMWLANVQSAKEYEEKED